MSKQYFSLNNVPMGTKLIVKKTKEEVELVEIKNFPTTFIAISKSGIKSSYYTHEVEIIDWPNKN